MKRYKGITMKGYKGMTKDMTCRGMQYEIGKTYYADGEIALCRNGLHFCEQLSNVFNFYKWGDGNRYFEVSADGQIVSSDTKSVASKLTIIRELTDIEVNKGIYNYDNGNSDGCSYGCGDSNSYGNGYGCGDNDGYGDGYGDGYCYGRGDGSGSGYGYGYGFDDGDGRGNGYGCVNISKILIYEGE